MPYICKAEDLVIGDIIQIAFNNLYLSATVYKITDKGVFVIRPYITYNENIATEEEMHPLIGMENMFYAKSDTVMLWERRSGTIPKHAHKFELFMK